MILIIVEMQCIASPQQKNNSNKPKNKFGPQSKNLASIVRGFKSAVTKNARRIDPDFGWQSGYHDHLIRNNDEYKRIENYIINNPKIGKKIGLSRDAMHCISTTRMQTREFLISLIISSESLESSHTRPLS